MHETINQPAAKVDFSLVLGGPLYQLFRKSHLSGDALELGRQRLLVITLLVWAPLLVLSLLGGRALGGPGAVPFLRDVEVHVRLLAALPLLIVAELVVHTRMRLVVQEFIDRKLVPASGQARFEAAIQASFRLRNSLVAELLLMAFVYGVGILFIWSKYVALSTATTWYSTPTPDGMQLTLAGRWYAYVSLPVFQFLLVRWYYRLFVWMRFLWQVSRIELSLVPTHPDRVGGLGFLGNTAFAFLPLATAHGAMGAGTIANRIFYLGAKLTAFKLELLLLVGFMLCLAFGPLLFFAPQLAAAKRRGNREYGTLAVRYVREFDSKWLRGGAPPDEPFVGSADIQSLADLGNSFEVVRTMQVAPISRDALLRIVFATLLPIVPLGLTMMPAEELLKTLFGILF